MRDPCIHSFITIIGSVSVTEDGEGNITGVFLPNQNLPPMDERDSNILVEAEAQVNEYLSGRRTRFDLPLSIEGTGFRMAVLEAISDIPFGETRHYSDIAELVGSPRAYRAVGTACAENPVPLIIPCHRVVPMTGIGKYAGGVSLKKRLLDMECERR